MKSRIHSCNIVGLVTSLAIAAGLPPAYAYAQYPDRPARLIIPFAAGGSTDIVGRMVAGILTEQLRSPFVAENRTGAGGTIGATYVAKAVPDGYTLMTGTPGSMTINPAMRSDILYDPLRDFDPISRVTSSPMVLTIFKHLPVNSIKELIALAKTKPNSLSFGSSGIGSTSHLHGEFFKMLSETQIGHVPYKGTSQGIIDLSAGRIQMHFGDFPAVMPFVKRGEIRLLAVGSTTRVQSVSDVPTVAESLAGYEATSWLGIFAPAKTQPPIIMKLHGALATGMRDPAVKAKLENMGYQSSADEPPEKLREYLKSKLAETKTLVSRVGLRSQ